MIKHRRLSYRSVTTSMRSLHLAAHMLQSILPVLHTMHSLGVCHLDISLDNLLLIKHVNEKRKLKKWRFQLIDYGFASHMDTIKKELNASTQIRRKVRYGKPMYACPEMQSIQRDDAEPFCVESVCPAADLYAIGVCAWHIASNSVPEMQTHTSSFPIPPAWYCHSWLGSVLNKLLSEHAIERCEALTMMQTGTKWRVKRHLVMKGNTVKMRKIDYGA